jgi:hypothetical protein
MGCITENDIGNVGIFEKRDILAIAPPSILNKI